MDRLFDEEARWEFCRLNLIIEDINEDAGVIGDRVQPLDCKNCPLKDCPERL